MRKRRVKEMFLSFLALLVLLSVGFIPMPAAAVSISLPVVSDVSLVSDSPDTNFGGVTHPYLWVGNNNPGNSPRDYETIFGFYIPDLVGPGEQLVLNSATVNTYLNYVNSGCDGFVRIAEGNTDNWDPYQVTWNNFHDNFGTELDSVYLASSDVDSWVSFDVSGAGADAFTDGFFTAYLYINPGDSLSWHDFENLESGGGHAAYMSLDYDVVPGSGAAPVPEPATMALLGIGLLGLGFIERRRQKVKS